MDNFTQPGVAASAPRPSSPSGGAARARIIGSGPNVAAVITSAASISGSSHIVLATGLISGSGNGGGGSGTSASMIALARNSGQGSTGMSPTTDSYGAGIFTLTGEDSAAARRTSRPMLSSQDALGRLSSTTQFNLPPAGLSPQMGIGITADATNRRGSYFSNNAYVPLGIRKLNALMAPGGGGGSGNNSASASDLNGAGGSGGGGASSGGGGGGVFKLPPNFGSHVQLFAAANAAGEGSDDETGGKSLIVRKKEIYAHLSLVFGFILTAFVMYDYVALLSFASVSALRPWLLSIQLLHVASFYLFLLAFIYANEAGDLRTLKKSIAALVLNLGSFAARVAFDLSFSQYMSV
ncbi:hypothetical protein BC828DRAFT_380398 [Blastocladiella britannica]|nr:hypothetical protein BC828DRAFT_380398 [Blastocladiella britannica]